MFNSLFSYWKNAKCRAKLFVNNYTSALDLEIIERTAHENHTPNPVETANRELDHRIRSLAATTEDPTRDVIRRSAAELPTDEGLIVLANRRQSNSAQNVQRQRKRSRREPEIPTTSFFDIPEEIRLMENGENFILGDWSDDQDRILLMG